MSVRILKPLPLLTPVLVLSVCLAGCSVLRGGKTSATDAVTTSIKDAYPVASWLNYFEDGAAAPLKSESFNLAPGYYTFNVQSYCLKAGTYAPTAGSGYLIAPLKGEKADVIASILRRSENHPSIKQQDIQRLIWGIETGANFSKYDASFQLKVLPLLSPEEIAILSVDYSVISQLLPDVIQDTLAFYNTLRSEVTNVQTSYAELERMAVLAGIAPMGPGSRDINAGPWSYDGNGFYMRALPQGYTKTTLEVIRPAQTTLKRDGKGRITVFQSGQYRIETSYDDTPGADVVSASGKPDIQIWRFKKIRFSGPEKREELTLSNKGWVIAPQKQIAMMPVSPPYRQYRSIQVATLTNGFELAQEDGSALELWNEANERLGQLNEINDLIEDVNRYRNENERAQLPPSDESIDDLTDLEHYRDAIEAATDFQERSKWLKEHLRRLANAARYITCSLAGDCLPGDDQPDLKEFDPNSRVATPANVNQQRLGLSRRKQ